MRYRQRDRLVCLWSEAGSKWCWIIANAWWLLTAALNVMECVREAADDTLPSLAAPQTPHCHINEYSFLQLTWLKCTFKNFHETFYLVFLHDKTRPGTIHSADTPPTAYLHFNNPIRQAVWPGVPWRGFWSHVMCRGRLCLCRWAVHGPELGPATQRYIACLLLLDPGPGLRWSTQVLPQTKITVCAPILTFTGQNCESVQSKPVPLLCQSSLL